MSDESIQTLRKRLPGIKAECLRKIKFGGVEAMPTSVDQCFEMTKPQRWQGLWLDAFEGQRFCPAPARTCEYGFRTGHIWITFPDDRKPTGRDVTGKTYAVQFIGRRTLRPGMHGHMGGSEHEILVDKLISVSPIGQ